MSDGERKVVIIKKVKKVSGGHHGGSWKVAYADFVTAMMAFFLVMWIMGMDEGVRDVVEGYFSNPVGFRQTFSGGRNPMSQGNAPIPVEAKNYMLLSRGEQTARFSDAAEQMAAQLEQAIDVSALSAAFEITLSEEGLRIELMERAGGDSFFEVGSSDLKATLQSALGLVVDELSSLPNRVVIEGHTDGRPFQLPGYTNWELSSDRANAARRALLELGLPPTRIAGIRGYADRELKTPESPYQAENRRISLLLPYQDDLVRRSPGLPNAAGGGGSSPADSSGADAR